MASNVSRGIRAPTQSLDCYREAFDDAKIGMAAACATGDFTMQAIAGMWQQRQVLRFVHS